MVTKDCFKIHLHFKFASLSVTIATAVISITLHFVRQIVNRHLCFGNQYQMCAYFTCFHGNISSCLMTLKCHLQSKVLSLLAEPPWSHHYFGCIFINIWSRKTNEVSDKCTQRVLSDDKPIFVAMVTLLPW